MDTSGVGITIGALVGFPILIYLLRMMCACTVVRHKHVAVVERFGKFHKIAEPGFHFLWPGVDSFRSLRWKDSRINVNWSGQEVMEMYRNDIKQICLNEELFDFPTYSFFSRDNVAVNVRPAMTFRVADPLKCLYEVYDLPQAVESLIQTTLRGLIGSMGLDDALASRSELTRSLLSKVTRECLGWGIEITSFHILEITPTNSIQQAMHRQISSERIRRAGVVEAQGYRESLKLEAEGTSFSSVVLAKAHAKVMEIEAMGESQARITMAKAEAEALNLLREVLDEAGVDPVQYMIATKYMEALSEVLDKAPATVIMPVQTDIAGSLRIMAKHHPDLIMCRKQTGVSVGRLCINCDGKCPICDSHVNPQTIVRICDACDYGSLQGRCVICGGKGVSDAYYCRECTLLEKDRDGCPKIVNIGTARTDRFYEQKKYNFQKR